MAAWQVLKEDFFLVCCIKVAFIFLVAFSFSRLMLSWFSLLYALAHSLTYAVCEIWFPLSASRRVLEVEMVEVNSRGTQLSFEVVTLGCRVTHWASCGPGTGTLSPSMGLWYLGGEMMCRLMVERHVDSTHM